MLTDTTGPITDDELVELDRLATSALRLNPGRWESAMKEGCAVNLISADRAVAIAAAPGDAGRWACWYIAAAAMNVPRLIRRIRELETQLDDAQLRSIEARNPGIDIDEVRRIRASR